MENNPDMLHNARNGRHLFPLGTAILLIAAGLLGCLAIYSSRAFGDEPKLFVLRQLQWLFPGVLMFLVSAVIPFRIYRKLSPFLMAAGIASLILVLFFGNTINGMRGWLRIGNVNFQPSELVKTFFLLFLCVRCGPPEKMTAGRQLALFLVAAVTWGLVMMEPDYGATVILFLIFLLIAVLSGAKLHYLLIAGLTMFTATLYFLLVNDYAMRRIIGFLNPDGANAWHIRQFQYTMAHGGWTGSDWGNALWSGSFLPLPHTDSLFASIVESTGFIGGLLVMAGFLFMAGVCCAISWKIRGSNNDRRFFIFSAGTLYLIQALIHISVNCVLIPPTGITLPLLSYGGSSLLAVMLTFGIAFSAARHDDNEPEPISSVPPPAAAEPRIDPAGSPHG